jgi:GTPase Era involved in 16S rRNA processing
MSMLIVHQLHEARERVLLLIDKLRSAKASELSAYQPFLNEQIAALEDAVAEAKIPESYRVAVVGRFKVGKSSFVNKLAGERLAGVDTNPETAAISIFKYDTAARADVEFVSSEEWERLSLDYEDDPKNPEVKRYDRFFGFNERPQRKGKDGKESLQAKFDLASLVKEWVIPNGKTYQIPAHDWGTKAGKKAFLAAIRKFTSSQEPLHYLVNKLTVYAPIPILRDQIELIDTPGLDDTERFRVQLTEDLVRGVDAILFLMISGASYSQSDKEFIIRQLRCRQIKHLQLIVTKCDETFENAVRDAKENDDDPPSFEQFRETEIRRVKAEAEATLNELLNSNKLSDDEGLYFIDQLDNVPVHLISTKYQEDGDDSRGGINQVRGDLYRILSASNRFEQSRVLLQDRLDLVLGRLRRTLAERLNTLETEFDPIKVREDIESIRTLLNTTLLSFESDSGEVYSLLSNGQEAFFSVCPTHLDNIAWQTKDLLNDLEKADLVRHWKTRRYGRWGYLNDLQNMIADRIFPRVESLLRTLSGSFDDYLNTMQIQITRLQSQMSGIELQHQLSGLAPLDLAGRVNPIFSEIRKGLEAVVGAIKDGIVTNLDDFVTTEVRERLDGARNKVSDIRGSGTTRMQDDEISLFYANIRTLLIQALKEHLSLRIKQFADTLVALAKEIMPKIQSVSETVISDRLGAIESALQIATAGQKEKMQRYLSENLGLVTNFVADPAARGLRKSLARIPENAEEDSELLKAQIDSDLQESHYEIKDGDTGFTYERIFRPYIDTATEILIEDPYIRKPYQAVNFLHFCALAVRIGVVEKITLVTGDDFGEFADDIKSKLDTLKRDLHTRNIAFDWSRDSKIHDREVRFDNGWVVKIGRGLDIYQPPENRASVDAADYGLRRCKQTKVDVFRIS